MREAGGRPFLRSPGKRFPMGGVALGREWTADRVQADFGFVSGAVGGLDALLVGADKAEDLAALLIVALRLDLPTVMVPAHVREPFAVALAATGFAPLNDDPARLAVEVARAGGPRPGDLLNGFSLANALRAGLAAGGGPELLVHLAAVAREAGEVGFSRMIRVLAPEAPAFEGRLRIADLLASLGEALHDVPTVEGKTLKDNLPEPPGERPAEGRRLRFVSGRASGVEAVVQAPPDAEEVAGSCRVFGSEDAAIEGVAEGRVGKGDLLVVAGRGVRGGPGLLRLDLLGEALAQAEVGVSVVTDGLPPRKPSGASSWISLFTPEAADGGVIGRLRDGDFLRFDLAEGRIRTDVSAEELASREPFAKPDRPGFGYAARYAVSALPALEGAGFG